VYNGICRFVIGLGKIALLANNIGLLWTDVAATDYATMSTVTAWLGVVAFTFRIYFCFSGLVDMGIGLVKIIGFNLPENFNYPYSSHSLTEFWQRWHIVLGNLSEKSRNRKLLIIFSIAAVWLLLGILHGAGWNLLLWAAAMCTVIAAEKLFLRKALDKIPWFLSNIYVMFSMMVLWPLFALPNFGGAFSYIRVMFGDSGNEFFLDQQAAYYIMNYWVILTICIFACTEFPKFIVDTIRKRLPVVVKCMAVPVIAAILVGSVAYLIPVQGETEDGFTLKNNLISLRNELERLQGKTEINGVFTTGDRMILAWRENPKTLQNADTLERVDGFAQRMFERHGIESHIMLVPTAQEIYMNLLPPNSRPGNQTALITRFYDGLAHFTHIDVATYLAENSDGYIFYRTDHHWTAFGAYWGYYAAAQKLGITPFSLGHFNVEHTVTDFRGTLFARTLNSRITPDVVSSYTLSAQRGGGATDNVQSLLIFGDGFADSVIEFLANHYSQITRLDLRFFCENYEWEPIDIEGYTQILFIFGAVNFAEYVA